MFLGVLGRSSPGRNPSGLFLHVPVLPQPRAEAILLTGPLQGSFLLHQVPGGPEEVERGHAGQTASLHRHGHGGIREEAVGAGEGEGD